MQEDRRASWGTHLGRIAIGCRNDLLLHAAKINDAIEPVESTDAAVNKIEQHCDLVVIGVSLGGVLALRGVLEALQKSVRSTMSTRGRKTLAL